MLFFWVILTADSSGLFGREAPGPFFHSLLTVAYSSHPVRKGVMDLGRYTSKENIQAATGTWKDAQSHMRYC